MKRKVTAKDIMSTDVLTIEEHLSVAEATDFFYGNMITGAPVVDGEGRMKGVLSLWDIARTAVQREAGYARHSIRPSEYYLEDWELPIQDEEFDGFQLEVDEELEVKDVMTSEVLSVDEATPVAELAQIMLSGRIHRLIITKENELVGIVTTSDLLKVVRDAF